jgi:hypothetical protein
MSRSWEYHGQIGQMNIDFRVGIGRIRPYQQDNEDGGGDNTLIMMMTTVGKLVLSVSICSSLNTR